VVPPAWYLPRHARVHIGDPGFHAPDGTPLPRQSPARCSSAPYRDWIQVAGTPRPDQAAASPVTLTGIGSAVLTALEQVDDDADDT
jgi:hypothetical protein